MEDRFEAISFPRIITTSSNSPYNDDVTPGKSVTSPWRPGIVLGGSLPTFHSREFPSSRDGAGVSSALAAVLFREIQPKFMHVYLPRCRDHGCVRRCLNQN